MKTFAVAFALLFPLFFHASRSSAHVTLEPTKAVAGAYTKLNFRVPHGCEGSATTKITVQIAEGSVSVKPQVHPGWKISMKKAKLKAPVMLHGKEILESVSEVTWAGGPLLDEHMDEFGISLKLPENASGQLAFPVIQVCRKGTQQWIESSTEEHAHHIKFPAPFLTLEAMPKQNLEATPK